MLAETVAQPHHTDAELRKILPATWKWKPRIHALATILVSPFPPPPPCNALPLPRVCPRLDRATQGSYGQRELGYLAQENLPPVRGGLGKFVPLHDICAALGTLARVHGGPGSSVRDQMSVALQLLPLNKASPLYPALPNPEHFRRPL